MSEDLKFPRMRCPVCRKRGWKRIARLGGRLVFWCRGGHPYHIIGEE